MALFTITKASSSVQKRVPSVTGCGACGLGKKCKTPKMGVYGAGEREILIINDIPSRSDDLAGMPLAGTSGEFLRTELKRLGISPEEDCWIINAVGCYSKDEITDAQIDWCQPTVHKTILELKPKVIITLGAAGLRSIMKDRWHKNLGGIQKWRGFCCPDRYFGAWVCPIYHPAYVLSCAKEPVMLKLYRDDLRRVIKASRTKIPDWVEEKEYVRILGSEKEIHNYLCSILNEQPKLLAFDYEATGLKLNLPDHRIISCSMSTDGKTAAAWMWDNMSVRCLEVFKEIMRTESIGKIASNMKYEDNATFAQLGYRVAGWAWDTMLAGHVMDNRSGITSIKFLAYVHCGVVPWNEDVEHLLQSEEGGGNSFNRITEIDPYDLLIYNGLDSIYEYQVAEQQMEVVECL